MHPFYNEFLSYLREENKEKCVNFILDKLEKKQIKIVELYDEILAPSLNTMFCDKKEEKLCIWKEHVRTYIIRTILECCYPYIVKERKEKGISPKNEKIVVVCPSDEFHEMGARMIVDFFTLLGFESIFVGANTPKSEIETAIQQIKPKFVAISVTNYYNLVEAEKAIKLIRDKVKFNGKIIVGGTAFKNNPEVYRKIGADYYLQTFDEIKKIVEGG